MATLDHDGNLTEITDGEPIKEACMELGVPFGCESGICGTCMIKIVEGMENLSPLNEAEEAMELDPDVRLGCQACIQKGTVKIKL